MDRTRKARSYGVSVNNLSRKPNEFVARIVIAVLAETGRVSMEKNPESDPAGIVNVGGTGASVPFVELMVTTVPPGGAGAFRVTCMATRVPPFTVGGP